VQVLSRVGLRTIYIASAKLQDGAIPLKMQETAVEYLLLQVLNHWLHLGGSVAKGRIVTLDLRGRGSLA
jgi:hypothetical protein